MLSVLVQDILPVFFMLALGFVLGRTGTASAEEARAINRIGFLILQPALIFPLIAAIDAEAFDLGALMVYAGCEALAFLAAFAVARTLFARPVTEAFLLGMAVVFVNSLLYIWPISYLIYGETAALPITAIVAWDASFSFAFFIVGMELLAGDRARGGAGRRIVTNPVLCAIALGAAVNLAGIPVPAPILTGAEFAGAGAAPLTLFALGVILSGQALRPSAAVAAIAGMKLVLFPALVFAAMALVSPRNAWTPFFVLNAAGPSGAMAFALAMLYKVPTDTVAPVIIWTSVLSLISLAMLA